MYDWGYSSLEIDFGMCVKVGLLITESPFIIDLNDL